MTQHAVVAVFKADATAFDGTLRGMNAGLKRWEASTLSAFARVEKGMDAIVSYSSKLRNLSYAVSAGFGVQQAAQFVDAAIRVRNQLRSIGEDGDASFQKVYLAATRSLSPLDTFVQSVVRMHKVMGDRQSLDVTIRQMETLSKLLAIGGKTGTERASVMLQFTQALQSGLLQGDELRSLRENAPAEFTRALAKAAGGTVGQLKEMGAQGKLTTDVMIRALDSLATAADQKMGQVQLAFGDAVNVLVNGALVAADAFNSGSGATATMISGLEAVGNALGQSKAAMEVFGRAVGYAGVALGVAFAGRKLKSAVDGINSVVVSQREGARQALLAARADQYAAQVQVQAATQVRDAKLAAYQAIQAKGTASAASVAKAQAAWIAAETRLGAANAALVASTNAVALAEDRVAFSARAMAAAGSLLRSAFAFIGGWPGILLIAATAFASVASSVRTTADIINDANQSISTSKSAISDLTDVQDRLNAAIEDSGTASDVAHQRIMSNAVSELNAKRALLQIENDRLAALKNEQTLQYVNLQRALDALLAQQKEWEAALSQSQGKFGTGAAYAAGIAGALEQSKGRVENLRHEIEELNAQITLTGLQMQANNDALATSGELLGEIAKQQALETAADSAGVLHDWLTRIADKMSDIAGFDLSGPFERAAGFAQTIHDWLAASLSVAQALNPLARYAKQAELNKDMVGRGRAASGEPVSRDSHGNIIDLTPAKRGGGRSINDDQQKALDFIREMMTAEEQRAAKLAEMVALRAKLIETYGPESELVAQLDDAIQRYKDDTEAAREAQAQFFDDLSTQIANAIVDWTNLGDVVRHILASIVQSYGVDFFTALLTPGKQSGNSIGTLLGNILTGQNHSGGDFGNQNARSVSPLAFIGAPRFHNGLMPDEFTAILQKGETVIPKGYRMAGPAVNINMPIDLRGADPSMKGFVEAQISQLKKELPGRVVQAVKSAQKSRALR